MSDFPSQVNVEPAIAVEGDFASTNPRAFALSPGGAAFIAGAAGVVMGRFAWADPARAVLSSFGSGAPIGFVPREQLAIIQNYLASYSKTLLSGQPVSVLAKGDVFAKQAGAAAVTVGMKAYAMFADGSIQFAATASPPSVAAVTGTIDPNAFTGVLAPNTATGSIAGTTMTVTAVGSGSVLAAGQSVTGTGVDPGTTIVSQLTGTAGGTGTYQVSVSQTVTATALTMSGGGLTVSAVATGGLYVGQTIAGSGVTSGTKISALGTGTGNTGTYAVDTSQTVGSESMTGNGGMLNVSAVSSGSLGVGDVLSGSGVTTGNAIVALYTGTGGTGKYFTSVGDSVGSEAITVAGGYETSFYAITAAGAGELVKMSTTAPTV